MKVVFKTEEMEVETEEDEEMDEGDATPVVLLVPSLMSSLL
jgi:hypothetical protein